MGFMAGKRALIVGLASNRSIAWGIAKAFAREGAELAFTYQNDKLKPRVEKFAEELGSNLTYPLDVGSDDEIDAVVASLGKDWDGLEVLVHSVGFAPRDQLAGTYIESVTREGFQIAHDISSYSLAALAKAFLPMMENRDSAILTLTYLGAVRAVPNYNVMGLAKASLEGARSRHLLRPALQAFARCSRTWSRCRRFGAMSHRKTSATLPHSFVQISRRALPGRFFMSMAATTPSACISTRSKGYRG
jgi:enoyl-[acyl-carrier protein] reductase I